MSLRKFRNARARQLARSKKNDSSEKTTSKNQMVVFSFTQDDNDGSYSITATGNDGTVKGTWIFQTESTMLFKYGVESKYKEHEVICATVMNNGKFIEVIHEGLHPEVYTSDALTQELVEKIDNGFLFTAKM